MVVLEPSLGVFAVLDGMGGAAAGEVAARLASEAIVHFLRTHSGTSQFSPRELLECAINTAGAAVFKAAVQHPDYKGMGTTVVACLLVDPTRVVIGHVGDSRAYLLRGERLQLLTHDHNLAQQFVDEGMLSPEAAAQSYFRSVLTRNLGNTNGVQADMVEQTIEPGDRVLLCSDGLYGSAPIDAIERTLASRALDDVAHELVALALRGEATDNISAIVIASEGGSGRGGPDLRSPCSRACARGRR